MQTITPNGINANAQFGSMQLLLVVRSAFDLLLRQDLVNVFFNAKEFATPVSYTHISGESSSYLGIFDEPFNGTNPGTDLEVITTVPQVRLRQDDLKRYPTKGDTCSIRGITYTVQNARPDGVGVMMLYLHRRDRQ